MNSMKKVLTTSLVISGATATISALEVKAAEIIPFPSPISTSAQALDELTDLDVIEEALRQFVNPLQQVHNHLKYHQPMDYIIYEVQEGDTISGISVQFGIPQREIVQENEISNKHRIVVGQQLKIRLKEQDYIVQHGQTLADIAEQKGVTVEEIIAYNPILQEGQPLTFPGQHLKIPTAPPEPAYQPLSNPRKNKLTIASRSDSRSSREISGFSWPVSGTITSSFGPRWGRMHNGIDIANSKKSETPIVAAKAGLVSEAYYHKGGYGNLVILDHGHGIETYYAHLSKIEVKVGDEVKEGEIIGYMGSTGNSTGYHLHFEIRKDNQPVNPIHYLPSTAAIR